MLVKDYQPKYYENEILIAQDNGYCEPGDRGGWKYIRSKYANYSIKVAKDFDDEEVTRIIVEDEE